MTSCTATAWMILQGTVLAARGGSITRRGSIDTVELAIYLTIAVVSIVVVCLGVYFGSRWNKWRRFRSPQGLFAGLCDTHGLDRAGRGLMKQVAQYHKLTHPARLFTEPKWLDPAGVKGPLSRQARQLTALRNRLFRESPA